MAAYPSTRICRFYLTGNCKKGSSCAFVHDNTDKAREELRNSTPIVCMYWSTGNCRNGNSCSFLHPEPVDTRAETGASSSSLPRTTQPLSHFPLVSEGVSYASAASWSLPPTFAPILPVSSVPPTIPEWGPEPLYEPSELGPQLTVECPFCSCVALFEAGIDDKYNEEHLDFCESNKAMEVEYDASKDIECGICMETVLDSPGGCFGLLLGCEHAFCLECIRRWRRQENQEKEATKSCPLCRARSHYIIPCNRFVKDKDRKQFIQDEYLRRMKEVPCRNFRNGDGDCPFGKSCHYSHLEKDGTPTTRYDRDQFIIGRNGGHHRSTRNTDNLLSAHLQEYLLRVMLSSWADDWLDDEQSDYSDEEYSFD